MASSGSPVSLKLLLMSLDHAHPELVAGHPFKGGDVFSIGMLANPEMAKFAIQSPMLFVPPNPMKTVDSPSAPAQPSFTDFYAAYFGSASRQVPD